MDDWIGGVLNPYGWVSSMSEYAYIRTNGRGERYYYHTDTAVSRTCTDEYEESVTGPSTIIAFWESDGDA
jgi:hypothetical protein